MVKQETTLNASPKMDEVVSVPEAEGDNINRKKVTTAQRTFARMIYHYG